MIKFFRHFRQAMIKENRASRYLLYAAGEIVLVVIGILIALQINTWNGEKQDHKQGILFLTDLQTDIEGDVATLKGFIQANDERVNAVSSIFRILDTQPELNDTEIALFFSYNDILSRESYFIPEKRTITQIGSTGGGNLISNKGLRDGIFRYYATNERIEQNSEKSIQLYQHNLVTDRIVQAVHLTAEGFQGSTGRTLDLPALDLEVLKQDLEYIKALGIRMAMSQGQNQVYRNLMNDAEELLVLIESELDAAE
jgi:hypothetical protein